MNTPEQAPSESRSSVEISLTAKGARQWKVKVYAADNTSPAVDAALKKAMDTDAELEIAYGRPE